MIDLVVHRLTVHLEGRVAPRLAEMMEDHCRRRLSDHLGEVLSSTVPRDIGLGTIDVELGAVTASEMLSRINSEVGEALMDVLRGAPASGTAVPEAPPQLRQAIGDGNARAVIDLAASSADCAADLRQTLAQPGGAATLAAGLADEDGHRLAALLDRGRAADAVAFRRRIVRAHRRHPLVAPDGGRFAEIAWAATLKALAIATKDVEGTIIGRIAAAYGFGPQRLNDQIDRRSVSTPVLPTRLPERPKPEPRALLYAIVAGKNLPPGAAAILARPAGEWARPVLDNHGGMIGAYLRRVARRSAATPARLVRSLPDDLVRLVFATVAGQECDAWEAWISEAARNGAGAAARVLAFEAVLGSEPREPLAKRLAGAAACLDTAPPLATFAPRNLASMDVAALRRSLGDAVLRVRFAASLDGPRLAELLRRFGAYGAARLAVKMLEAARDGTARTALAAGLLAGAEKRDTGAILSSAIMTLARETGETPARAADALVRATRSARLRQVLSRLRAELAEPPLPCEPPARPNIPAQGIACSSAGLVLIWPFLATAFARLGWMEDDQFVSDDAQAAAARFLIHLAMGDIVPDKAHAVPRLLAGLAPIGPPPDGSVTVEAAALASELFDGLRHVWTALSGTSNEGIRESLLARNGRLARDEEGWRVDVAPAAFDMLLDTVPWPLSLVQLPWLDGAIRVKWR